MRFAEFTGGPMKGRRVPEDVVPWPLFVPREPGDFSPPRNLSRDDVTARSHYALVRLTANVKTYRWVSVAT